jgi:hypothetical protein
MRVHRIFSDIFPRLAHGLLPKRRVEKKTALVNHDAISNPILRGSLFRLQRQPLRESALISPLSGIRYPVSAILRAASLDFHF